jgi:hypothetical protein
MLSNMNSPFCRHNSRSFSTTPRSQKVPTTLRVCPSRGDAAEPMLPLSLFGQRMFALTSLVGLLVNVAF